MAESTHDNVVDFVTGAGPGGGPHVRKWLGQVRVRQATSPHAAAASTPYPAARARQDQT